MSIKYILSRLCNSSGRISEGDNEREKTKQE